LLSVKLYGIAAVVASASEKHSVPPPHKKSGATVSPSPRLETFSSDLTRVAAFPFFPIELADARIRSENFSPLGAASQSFADSLSFVLRACAPEVKK
jgi:hypothetical protein